MFKVIKKRRSIRSYEKKTLSENDLNKTKEILEFVEKKQGPFNHRVKFFYVDNKNTDGRKIGTYGFIKNAPAFIAGVVKNTKEGMIDYGFLFEKVILHLTEAGLGTVWLGGTFSRDDFDVDTNDDEIIAAVSPVGYSTAKQSIREKVIRGFAKADKRKPFDELFFLGKNLTSIDDKHKYYKYLQAVQVGPSASNKQPWRIVLLDDTFHLYLNRTKGYGDKLIMDIQAIDMGIALSHLYLTLKADNHSPMFSKDKQMNLKDCEYIISIKINEA
ncbi:MAG: nitroreductase [Candidatus Izimaplasma sp.]|nr:nitroreductase [Candidatus Izimaplasma bacterium]